MQVGSFRRRIRSLVRSVRWFAVVGAVSIVAVLPTRAAESEAVAGVLVTDPSLALREVVERAASVQPGAELVEGVREEAGVLGDSARSWLSAAPALSAELVTDRAGSGDGYRSWSGGVELPLWMPGQRAMRRAAAAGARAQAGAAERQWRLAVAGRVREVVGEVELARTHLALARIEAERAEALERSVRRAVELGELARTDLLAASDRVLEARGAHVAARTALEQAEQRYVRLTGLDRIPQQWEEDRAPALEIPLDHPLLVEARARVDRAEAELSEAKRTGWGTPALGVGAERERAERRARASDRLVVGMRLPFGPGGEERARIATAARGLGEARTELRLRTLELHEALDRIGAELASADEIVRVSSERRDVAAESLRLATRAFALGEIDLADLLRIQARAESAERALAEAAIRQRIQTARFNQTIGVLP